MTIGSKVKRGACRMGLIRAIRRAAMWKSPGRPAGAVLDGRSERAALCEFDYDYYVAMRPGSKPSGSGRWGFAA